MDTLRYAPGTVSKAPQVILVKSGVPYGPARFGMVARMQKHVERKLAHSRARMAEVEQVA